MISKSQESSNVINAEETFKKKREKLSEAKVVLSCFRSEIKEKIRTKINCEKSAEIILTELKEYNSKIQELTTEKPEDFLEKLYSEAKEELKRKPSAIDREDESTKAHIDLIKKCFMVQNIEENSQIIFVDPLTGEAFNYDISGVIEMLGKEFSAYKKENIKLSLIRYNAFNSLMMSKDKHNRTIYNTYQAPSWRLNNYLKQEEILIADLPECYKTWFKNLVSNHEDSYEYLLDWIATSLTSRNYTYLTMIGEEGIGKGVTGQIFRQLHGESNYRETSGAVFKTPFNSELINKTLVYVDEVSIKNTDDINRVKAVANDKIRAERKGVDAEEINNFASYVFSSNEYDGLKIGDGDRRFSIIELTDKKVQDVPEIKELVDNETLTKPENIERFARYLYNRKITRNMKVPFKASERAEIVQKAGMKEWQKELLEVSFKTLWNSDTASHEQIKEYVQKQNNIIVGRDKLVSFFKMFPVKFKVVQNRPNCYSITQLKDPLNIINF